MYLVFLSGEGAAVTPFTSVAGPRVVRVPARQAPPWPWHGRHLDSGVEKTPQGKWMPVDAITSWRKKNLTEAEALEEISMFFKKRICTSANAPNFAYYL